MKAIMVMYDSLNRHMLPNYGCDWVQTPNFERLTDSAVTFDNHYVGSMPCMPARREMHTGRYNFLHRSWGPHEPFDDSTFSELKNNGIYSHLVSDHYHYWEDGGATYHHRYSSWVNVRGQEGDRWKGQVADPEVPEHHGRLARPFLVNKQYMQEEHLTPQAQTFSEGLEFLQTNWNQNNWYLQIETFDPHEPFFTLKQWKDRYNFEWNGPEFEWPKYERVTEDPDAQEYLRYQYAALLTQCDHYLGKVMDFMDDHSMWDDTMLMVVTDHGFLLGEHDWWGKMRMPWYNEIAHIPLFIWDPRLNVRGERRSSLTQTIDLGPTILEFFGLEIPKDMIGRPLREVIKDDTPHRDAALFGMFGGHVNVTDGRYTYMRAPETANYPLNHYTLMPSHLRRPFSTRELEKMTWNEPLPFSKKCPVMKIPSQGPVGQSPDIFETKLFDLENDPGQTELIHNPVIEKTMIELMITVMQEHHAPNEQYIRLGLGIPNG